MLKILEKLLGLGVIPEDWKQRIYSLLLALIAAVEMFYDIPDEYTGEAFVAKLAAILAVVAAFAMKQLRSD